MLSHLYVFWGPATWKIILEEVIVPKKQKIKNKLIVLTDF